MIAALGINIYTVSDLYHKNVIQRRLLSAVAGMNSGTCHEVNPLFRFNIGLLFLVYSSPGFKVLLSSFVVSLIIVVYIH
jgi:hypothetical protein